jgi:hypothetical protein
MSEQLPWRRLNLLHRQIETDELEVAQPPNIPQGGRSSRSSGAAPAWAVSRARHGFHGGLQPRRSRAQVNALARRTIDIASTIAR